MNYQNFLSEKFAKILNNNNNIKTMFRKTYNNSIRILNYKFFLTILMIIRYNKSILMHVFAVNLTLEKLVIISIFDTISNMFQK